MGLCATGAASRGPRASPAGNRLPLKRPSRRYRSVTRDRLTAASRCGAIFGNLNCSAAHPCNARESEDPWEASVRSQSSRRVAGCARDAPPQLPRLRPRRRVRGACSAARAQRGPATAVDRHDACLSRRRRRVPARLAGVPATRARPPRRVRAASQLSRSQRIAAGREARRGVDLRLSVCALSRPHAPACGPDLRRGAAVSLVRDRAQQRSDDAVDRRPRRKDLRLLGSRFEFGLAGAQFTVVPAGQGRGDVLPQDLLHLGPSPGRRCGRRRTGARGLGRWLRLGHAARFIIPKSPSRLALRIAPSNTASRRS